MMLKKQSSDNVVQMVLTKLAAGDVEFDPSVWKKCQGENND